MYQILLRENYKFDESKYLIFLKTLQGYKKGKSDGNKSLFSKVMQFMDQEPKFKYVIDCDEKGKVNFYFDDLSNNNMRFNDSLKQLFSDQGDVYSVPDLEYYSETHTFSFEETVLERYEDGNPKLRTSLKTYDENALKFILSSMPKFTRIILEFSCKPLNWKDMRKRNQFIESDHSELTCTLQVKCKTKYMRNELKSLSQAIQQITRASGAFFVEYKEKYKPFSISTEYLLNLIALPSPREMEDKVYFLTRMQRTLKAGEYEAGVKIGTNNHPKQINRDVRIPVNQMKKHLLVTGSTGSGKSSVFEEMAKDIIVQKLEGKLKIGFTFFDPAEASALGLINIIRQLEYEGYDIEKILPIVHYIDFNSSQNVFAMNLLDKTVNREKHMDYFRDIFGEGNTPQLDRLLINAISALIEDEEDHVISDVGKLLMDEEYRLDVLDRLKSNMYAQPNIEFLETGIPSAKKSMDPVLNRLDIFVNSIRKNRMFNSGISDLKHIRKWMDEGHIVIANLTGMSSKDIQVIVGYISVQYYNVAMTRPPESLAHFLVADEDHKVQLKIIENIRAECRKVGLSFIGMTQFLDQYKESYLQDTIENTGTKITLRQGEIGAGRIAKSTSGINKEEYINLADRHGFLYTQNGNQIESIPFIAKPPYRYLRGKLIEYGKSDFDTKIAEAIEDDRDYALKLMARDFSKIEDIDRLVFKSKTKKTVKKNGMF